ncbi:hypothetical protein K469DRAFT_756361 [Zopfia rhizophila CBS 207.26]|uniref:Uncharacterized protein n=1 Tax=Zopfia rhizophila CBS 207.26 TaxID=1314779 RepID=A0A6A6D5B6_9PEZI|nr:hypothetical protein K469DRAFT_756689 [Zopfia rhizophila CBS 207.26]KAF2175206.1 hypothetical protein K469DRAFT_756361 [Zopfia rhizophila CBS 207.26]
MDVGVVTYGGQQLSLGDSLGDALQALNKDGWIILKGATSVPSPSETLGILDFVTEHTVQNKAVQTILFSARNDGFRIAACLPYIPILRSEGLGRDYEWEKMANQEGLMGAMCYHLGGDQNVSWVIHVDKCSRGADSANVEQLKAKGGDIFICQHWLRRSKPFLEKEPTSAVRAVAVSYIWTGYSERGVLDRPTGDKILKQFGNNYSRIGNYVVWAP